MSWRLFSLGLALLTLTLAGCCHHNQSRYAACCPPPVTAGSAPCCPTPGCSNFGTVPPPGTATAVVPGFAH
jgi:hypothetical protein